MKRFGFPSYPLLLLGLALLSLLVKAAYTTLVVGWHANPLNDPGATDAQVYQALATSLFDGKGYTLDGVHPTTVHLPLYPVFIAEIYRLFGQNNYVAVRGVQILLASFAPILVFQIGSHLLDDRTAWLAAGLVAIDPLLTYFAPVFLSENLYLILLLVSVAGFSSLMKRFSWLVLIFSSVILGLAMLTRANMVILPGLLFIWSALLWKKRGIWAGVLILAIVGLVMSGWVIRNWVTFGAFIPFTTNGGEAFYVSNNSYAQGNWIQGERQGGLVRPVGATEMELDRNYYRLGLEWIQANPRDFAILVVKKVVRLFDFDPHTSRQDIAGWYWFAGLIPYGLMLPFILFGLFALIRTRSMWLLYAVLLAAMLNTMMIYGDSRFRAPIQPYLYLFGSWGIWKFAALAMSKRFFFSHRFRT